MSVSFPFAPTVALRSRGRAGCGPALRPWSVQESVRRGQDSQQNMKRLRRLKAPSVSLMGLVELAPVSWCTSFYPGHTPFVALHHRGWNCLSKPSSSPPLDGNQFTLTGRARGWEFCKRIYCFFVVVFQYDPPSPLFPNRSDIGISHRSPILFFLGHRGLDPLTTAQWRQQRAQREKEEAEGTSMRISLLFLFLLSPPDTRCFQRILLRPEPFCHPPPKLSFFLLSLSLPPHPRVAGAWRIGSFAPWL